MSHEDIVNAFKARAASEEKDLMEAALAIIEDGRQAQVTSAVLFGEFMKEVAEWQEGWSDLGEMAYRSMVEIARSYLRGA